MTDDNQHADHPAEADTVGQGEASPDPLIDISGDRLFNFLVHLAEAGAEIGVTVYTQGLVFSGRLISRRRYFEFSSELVRGQNGLATIFEELFKLGPDDEFDPSAPVSDYKYVHLANAQVMSNGEFGMPRNGTLMRILRSDIVGWSLGQLEAANN